VGIAPLPAIGTKLLPSSPPVRHRFTRVSELALDLGPQGSIGLQIAASSGRFHHAGGGCIGSSSVLASPHMNSNEQPGSMPLRDAPASALLRSLLLLAA